MLHTGIYKSAHLACIRSACRAIVALCQEYGPRATRTLTRILRLENEHLPCSIASLFQAAAGIMLSRVP